ncbi:hepatocyte growth factor activator serine protease [Chelonoidis abingdonii]|uniref:hepatocyte growth factor activator serine protease n=1 Tax=Chelonoidis abingdonii TaxID=106734 RepID=UPI0013F18BAA|nr:hepatocyte growth factor activator [Chelonoidis abingdonii]
MQSFLERKMKMKACSPFIAVILALTFSSDCTGMNRGSMQRRGPVREIFHHRVFTEDEQLCTFPFRYGGRMYHTCISNLFSQKKWCSTTHNYDRDRKWGYCASASKDHVDFSDYCAKRPCKNGGTCSVAYDHGSYHCACPEAFTGKDCEIGKCFDESRYEYFDTGESWARIHKGVVEECTCVNSRIECQNTRYTRCTSNPCLHDSACRMIVFTGKTICGCKENFVGKYCNIVPSQQCYRDNGTEYRGVVKMTVSGHSCVPWNSDLLYQELHVDSVEKAVQLGLGPYSYCRNPDNDEKPWCYIMKDNTLSWEYCNITSCDSRKRTSVVPVIVDTFAVVKRACGRRHKKRSFIRPRIIGGSSSLPGSHPWLAAIYIGNSFCGGSLVHPCWVVSAAHCFANSPLKSSIRIVLGQHLFNKTTDVTQTFEIEKYILHPDYSVFNPTEHDIVLIRLKKNNQRCAVKTQFVQPVCLPESGMSFPDQHKCQIAGWGHRHENASNYSNVLQEALVPIVPDHKCRSPEVYGDEVSEYMFCAGYFDSKSDACQGDSGGSLACEKNKISYLYGIISWGDGCGRVNKPGVYTRVTKYVDWINKLISPGKQIAELPYVTVATHVV